MIKRKGFSLALAAALAVTSVMPVYASEGQEKHAVMGSTGYFTTSSADTAADYNGWYETMMGVCESLFRLDYDFIPQPYLVSSYENTDDTTWVFELRDDVTFHNGEKMTAESVKACFERTLEVNARAASQIAIESIEADGQTLTIHTSQAVPTMINDLCDSLWNVYYVGDDVEYETQPYATGPFEITSYEQGVCTSVKAYEGYWGGRANIDSVDFLVGGDQDSLAMSLQAGEIDLICNPSATVLPLFSDESTYTIDSVTSTRATYLFFNLEHESVQDVAVRNAISMCIDRETFSEVVMNGTTEPCYGIFSSSLPYGGTEGLDPIVTCYDPEGAAQMLEDTGWADTNGDGVLDKDGVELNLDLITFASRPENATLADALQSALAQIGINLNAQVMESTSDALAAGQYDISLGSFTMAPTGDSAYFFNTRIVTDGPSNQGHYSNEKVDELVGQLVSEFDNDKRIALTKEISQELLNDCYYILPANHKFTMIYNNEIINFSTHPCEFYLLDKDTDLVVE